MQRTGGPSDPNYRKDLMLKMKSFRRVRLKSRGLRAFSFNTLFVTFRSQLEKVNNISR